MFGRPCSLLIVSLIGAIIPANKDTEKRGKCKRIESVDYEDYTDYFTG